LDDDGLRRTVGRLVREVERARGKNRSSDAAESEFDMGGEGG